MWKSGVTVIDGPDGFRSLSDMMGSTFDSWLWVVVFGVISGLVWCGELAALARRTADHERHNHGPGEGISVGGALRQSRESSDGEHCAG